MNKGLSSGVTQAGLLAFIGSLTGIVSGWGGLLFAGSTVAMMAAFHANVYLALAVLLPLALVVWNVWGIGGEDPELYTQVGSLVVMLLLGAVLGAIGATILFAVVTVQIPSVFRVADAATLVQLRTALMESIGWLKFFIVLFATCLGALGSGILTYWKSTHPSS